MGENTPLLAASPEYGELSYSSSRVQSYRDAVKEKQSRSRIRAIFVVEFHTVHGNNVQWQHPEDFDLSHVAFKAMPSGLHHVDSDYVYFKHGTLYGISCFHKRITTNVEERNARMISVGVLMDHYESLMLHMEFLATESRRYTQQQPDTRDTSRLLDLFTRHSTSLAPTPRKAPVAPFRSYRPFVTSFTDFWEFFGPSVFVIWRCLMLRLRVLLFSTVPIGPLSSSESVWDWLAQQSHGPQSAACPPFFFVSLADMSELASSTSFIACTSDSIFREKTSLWDVFLEREVALWGSSMSKRKSALGVSRADVGRYRKLTDRMRGMPPEDREVHAIRFFYSMSSGLLERVTDSGQSDVLTVSELSRLGLSLSDAAFVKLFVHTHNLPVTFQYCPCCGC